MLNEHFIAALKNYMNSNNISGLTEDVIIHLCNNPDLIRQGFDRIIEDAIVKNPHITNPGLRNEYIRNRYRSMQANHI